MAATKMFFITWFSSSTHLKFFRSGFGYADLSVLVFNQMILIFHLDMFFRLMGNLLESLLKYNALEVQKTSFQTTSRKSSRRLLGSLPNYFKNVFQKTFRKSSGRLQRSLLDDFQIVFQKTKKSSDGVFFHIKWSLSLSS
ncbi:hypothetical protein DY000_02022661 [Brassica cretica]|uniref:Uncharacterized protein n=1 Tax=Brassica cretica TaxID=69181 RepID=A0ABQ7EBJ0_BRACR|nr:hypothetical protein DY000_02022661 [Brassica cretica]